MTREEIIHTLPNIKKIAEIGTLRGQFAANLLKTNPDELHLIDPYKCYDKKVFGDYTKKNQADWDNMYEFVCKKFSNDNRVKIYRKESIEGAKLFPDNYFDLVYIDANHSYEFVKNDINAWYPKVKKGGFICGHDIEAKGVFTAVMEYFKIDREYNGQVYDKKIGNIFITSEYELNDTKSYRKAKSWFYQK